MRKHIYLFSVARRNIIFVVLPCCRAEPRAFAVISWGLRFVTGMGKTTTSKKYGRQGVEKQIGACTHMQASGELRLFVGSGARGAARTCGFDFSAACCHYHAALAIVGAHTQIRDARGYGDNFGSSSRRGIKQKMLSCFHTRCCPSWDT